MKAGQKDIRWLLRWRDIVLPDAVAQETFAFQERMLAEQDRSAPAIAAARDHQIRQVVAFARAQVPHYQRAFAALGPDAPRPGTAAWAALPVLTREDLREHRADLLARTLPPGHRSETLRRSSGSTGEPVTVMTTNISNHWQKVLALRAAVWARRDFTGRLAVIRKLSSPAARLPDGETTDHWADRDGFPFRTGPRHALDAQAGSTDEVFAWLARVGPDYLMTYPSILRDIAASAERSGQIPGLRGITTLGETVDDPLRAQVKAVWGLGIDDVYSAEECGIIAMQCPTHGRYHIPTEVAHIEVVDDGGVPLPPGQPGRVLVTTLANFAQPLIRYAVGDHAVQAPPCGCGRAGPVLQRILGRDRNLLVTARGRFWPSFGTRRFQSVAPVLAQQFRQTALDRIETRFVSPRDLTEAEVAALTALVQAALPVPMAVALVRVPELPRGAGGKFEVFVSDLA